ncbi:multidrug resistance protein A, partial [mine drainage metagenome]
TVEIVSHTYGKEHAYHGKVLGLDPSGGSTFSLFPANNATGNYIHIVERIPVRISLSRSELTDHPLRPGMSVKVKIDTSHHDEFQTLVSKVVLTDPSYATALYEKEVDIAQEAADKIIRGNL